MRSLRGLARVVGLKGSRKGRFRIQSVAEMTGVPASTLRAWEQRYGFPSPERTASSYRVYSDADVQRIAKIRSLCDSGMAPAEAVAEILEQEERAAAPPSSPRPPAPAERLAAPGELSPIAQRILDAVTEPDPAALDEALRSAMLLGSPQEVYSSALAPAWTHVRDGLASGRLDVGRERIAAEVFGHAARDLVRLGQPRGAGRSVVLATASDEDDMLPLLPVAFAAQAGGRRALLLPAHSTPHGISGAAEVVDADFVALAITEAPSSRRAISLLDDFARRMGDRRWLVCGPAAVALAETIESVGGLAMTDNTLPEGV